MTDPINPEPEPAPVEEEEVPDFYRLGDDAPEDGEDDPVED